VPWVTFAVNIGGSLLLGANSLGSLAAGSTAVTLGVYVGRAVL
jgi:fluoride ion exporter CrcB/FEX